MSNLAQMNKTIFVTNKSKIKTNHQMQTSVEVVQKHYLFWEFEKDY